MSERQAANLAGLRAREMETHAQKQIAELNQREACMQQNWQLMQQECATLIRDKESLMQNLIVCQDMIREEAQAHQQQQRQLLEQVQTPQLVDDPHALPGRSELWGATAGEALTGRDGGRLFRPGMSAAEVRDDGRSLRQSLDAKSTQDGGRPLRGSEFGLGQPAGFAIGPTLSTNSYAQVGNSDAKLPRVHNSHAEREPHVQARGQSMYGLDPGVHVPADREPPRARARSPSPPSHEYDRPVPMERPR